MKDFRDKILFVTGGPQVRASDRRSVPEAGCKVVIADIRQDHLDQAMAYFREKGAPAHAIQLDITDRAAYAAAADEVEEVFGSPPQLLFNTAGVNAFGPPEASTYEDYDWIMGVCLDGVINGMVTFVPRMIKAGKGGHIVSTASMGGFWGTTITAPYSAAKAAVINLMESYSLTLGKYGIGVSVLCPAAINSNIHNAAETRPANLASTGYLTDEKAVDTLRTIYEAGMDPVDLAKWVKKGIEDEQLYIPPLSRRTGSAGAALQTDRGLGAPARSRPGRRAQAPRGPADARGESRRGGKEGGRAGEHRLRQGESGIGLGKAWRDSPTAGGRLGDRPAAPRRRPAAATNRDASRAPLPARGAAPVSFPSLGGIGGIVEVPFGNTQVLHNLTPELPQG